MGLRKQASSTCLHVCINYSHYMHNIIFTCINACHCVSKMKKGFQHTALKKKGKIHNQALMHYITEHITVSSYYVCTTVVVYLLPSPWEFVVQSKLKVKAQLMKSYEAKQGHALRKILGCSHSSSVQPKMQLNVFICYTGAPDI